ncbi:hypothetical protein [Elizabethkingia argenteiflava]|uniref:hypothetical protein n=1 Tax=Elizabethkingia argenteiflava TaxID=2681556 RepID=UPI001FCECEE1|nr:hypothetical protein [Elizabethkingia argenteiflava]
MFESILIVIIIFFTWNILKRIFFRTFYQGLTGQNTPDKQNKTESRYQKKTSLNWDAKTVEYEEIKDENEQKK